MKSIGITLQRPLPPYKTMQEETLCELQLSNILVAMYKLHH